MCDRQVVVSRSVSTVCSRDEIAASRKVPICDNLATLSPTRTSGVLFHPLVAVHNESAHSRGWKDYISDVAIVVRESLLAATQRLGSPSKAFLGRAEKGNDDANSSRVAIVARFLGPSPKYGQFLGFQGTRNTPIYQPSSRSGSSRSSLGETKGRYKMPDVESFLAIGYKRHTRRASAS